MIDSLHNAKVTLAAKLADKKARDDSGLFVVEGKRFADEIPPGWPVEFFLITGGFAEAHDCAPYAARGAVYSVSNAAFKKASGMEAPQGILAVCAKRDLERDFAYILQQADLLALPDKVADPGNVGAIWRAADAAAGAVVLSKGCADAYNPKVIRSAAGSVFHTPIVTEADLPPLIQSLRRRGVACYGASLDGAASPYALPLTEPTAFAIGNEANGLSAQTRATCDGLVKLPMPGQAESLNAAVSCGILLYEAVRQRLTGGA